MSATYARRAAKDIIKLKAAAIKSTTNACKISAAFKELMAAVVELKAELKDLKTAALWSNQQRAPHLLIAAVIG